MTLGETIAAAMPFACLVVALFRARLVAIALTPSCIGIITMLVGVDLSSASHPLRWIVPIATAALAGFGVWYYSQGRTMWLHLRPKPGAYRDAPQNELWAGIPMAGNWRAALASLLILGSCAPDLLALHPWFWRFTEWALVPIQIAVCSTVLVVFLAPERWVVKCFQNQ